MVKREALTQIDKGAELLDVNLGVPGLDITELMATVITELSSMVDTPFQLLSKRACELIPDAL